MKIHILFDTKAGSLGGGSQFLKCLKAWLSPNPVTQKLQKMRTDFA